MLHVFIGNVLNPELCYDEVQATPPALPAGRIKMKRNEVYGMPGDQIEMKKNEVYGVSNTPEMAESDNEYY